MSKESLWGSMDPGRYQFPLQTKGQDRAFLQSKAQRNSSKGSDENHMGNEGCARPKHLIIIRFKCFAALNI